MHPGTKTHNLGSPLGRRHFATSAVPYITPFALGGTLKHAKIAQNQRFWPETLLAHHQKSQKSKIPKVKKIYMKVFISNELSQLYGIGLSVYADSPLHPQCFGWKSFTYERRYLMSFIFCKTSSHHWAVKSEQQMTDAR